MTTETRRPPRPAGGGFMFSSSMNQLGNRADAGKRNPVLDQIRIVPASPSYFTASPTFTDDFLRLSTLLGEHQHLPQNPSPERTTWLTHEKYSVQINENVRKGQFNKLIEMVERLNKIHPSLMPQEVAHTLSRFKRVVQSKTVEKKQILPDKYGRTRGVGRRKSSSAECLLVEGDGEVLVNGRTLTNYFGRLHDRESAIWALKATNRADKYNIWARALGGGTTGQAEAIQLAVAKALLAQEPALQPALKRAGVLLRDPRVVERKKHGKLKARKMPAWVKR